MRGLRKWKIVDWFVLTDEKWVHPLAILKYDGTFEERERVGMDGENENEIENGGESKSIGIRDEKEKGWGKETEGEGSIIPTRMEEEEGEGMPSESLQNRIEETARQLQEMGFSPEEVGRLIGLDWIGLDCLTGRV